MCGEQKYFRKIMRKYWEKTNVHLNKKENQELSMLMSEIEASVQGRGELERVFKEAGKTLKEDESFGIFEGSGKKL